MFDVATNGLRERVAQIEAVLDDQPVSLNTANSPGSVRSSSGSDLATLPYLTINDIIQLKAAGFHELEDLEERILEVPEAAWEHVIDLVRARVLEPERAELMPQLVELEEKARQEADLNPQCLALTKSGTRCKNAARTNSKYCASHKGYQPSQEELEARREGRPVENQPLS